jgi:hypothetical protein
MCIIWQDLSIGTKIFYQVTLKFDPLFKNFNIGHSFWIASDRTFIFHMCVPYDKTFLLVPKLLTLWLWPWSLTRFLKNFHFGHVFWMVLYFICMLLVTRPLYWSRKFWNLDLGFWRWLPPLEFASYLAGAFASVWVIKRLTDCLYMILKNGWQ